MRNAITFTLRCFFLFKGNLPMVLVSSCIGFVLLSCNFSSRKDSAEALTAKAVVENAINTAGTFEKWKNIASLSYTKKSRLFLENGEIESEVTQRHHYVLRPSKSIRIAWTLDKDSFLIVHNDSISQKFKNDSLIDQGSMVKSAVNSASYVLGMPFKLLDKGTKLSYEGLKSLNTRDTVHAIKATYAPTQYKNHATEDVWWYHFNKDNYIFSSSLVYHEPTYALIENVIVVQAEGITFPGVRKSYRCDETGKKQFLRAQFWYEDYDIAFLKE